MSAVTEEVKPEDGKLEPEKKIFYCEVCKVPCMSSISLQSHYRGAKHRKKEKALRPKTVYCPPAPAQSWMKCETQRPVKRGLTKHITCLKDFMNDPKREEPLVGLEHVVEFRFEGRKEPHYECRLCGFNTEIAPMIEHLSGYKHRRAYISTQFPAKMKRKTTDAKECKVSFLRRIAGELEKTEGLKMYKIEGYIRPSISSPSKKKARWEDDYEHENDPVRKQKALEFLKTFHITSDSEATLVVHITQELTEALKAFCEKKAAVNYTNSLRPLMSVSHDEFPGRKSIPKHYTPYGKSKGNPTWSQGFLSQYEQRSEDASVTPANQTDDGSSSYGLRSNAFAMMSALRDSFALQTGSPASCISEWLRQFSQFASGSNSAGGASSCETNSMTEHSAEYMSNDVQESRLPDNRISYGRESTNLRNQQACKKAGSISDQGLPCPSSSASYPSSGRYSTKYPSQSYSAYKNNESVNTCTSSANSAVLGGSGCRWNEDLRWNEESRWNKGSGCSEEPRWNEDSRWNKDSRWNEDSRWDENSKWNQEPRWNKDTKWSREPRWNKGSKWNQEPRWNKDTKWSQEPRWNEDFKWNQEPRWIEDSEWNREPRWNEDSRWNQEPRWNKDSRWNEDSKWNQEPRWNKEPRWNEGSRWNQKSGWNKESSWNQESSWIQESKCQGSGHQKSDYKSDWSSHQYSFSGSGSYRDYQRFRSSDKMLDEDDVGFNPNRL